MALYDPNEFPAETKTGTDFTLADVLAWARTKPADEGYEYTDTENCVVCRFLRETGRASKPNVVPDAWSDGQPVSLSQDKRPLDPAIDQAAVSSRTFGAFADRLEQALAR